MADTMPDSWSFGPMPPIDGWFAVQRCWDTEEGICLDVVYAVLGRVDWPANGGMSEDGSTGHAGPFASRREAEEWAYAHDPEG